MHSTVTKHAYHSQHQRKFAYTNIFWLGNISKLLFHTAYIILIDYDVCDSIHSVNIGVKGVFLVNEAVEIAPYQNCEHQ